MITMYNFLCTDNEYVNKIKTVINQAQMEYEYDDSVNPNLLWEMFKMKVREESLKYGVRLYVDPVIPSLRFLLVWL